MKIIFLDIDGVLNSHRTCLALGGIPSGLYDNAAVQLDPLALCMIRSICELSGAKIVLSSTWRLLRSFEDYAKELNLPIIDKTAHGSENGKLRGNEIEDWLSNHPCVTQYAIIDDDSDFLEYQRKVHVHTKHDNGFLLEHAVQLAHILGVDPWDRPRVYLD